MVKGLSTMIHPLFPCEECSKVFFFLLAARDFQAAEFGIKFRCPRFLRHTREVTAALEKGVKLPGMVNYSKSIAKVLLTPFASFTHSLLPREE